MRARSVLLLLVISFLPVFARAQAQTSNTVPFSVVALPSAPTITSIAPKSAYAGGPAVSLTVTGTNFTATGCTVDFDATVLVSTFVSTTSMTATIPATSIATVGSHNITVVCTPPLLSLESPVALPNGTSGQVYSANLGMLAGVSGGVAPYNFSLASGSLPTGLSLSSAGIIGGTPSSTGSFNFTYTVTDASGAKLNIPRGAVIYASLSTDSTVVADARR